MLSLYYHTLRYLKPSQIYWRIWYRFIRPKLKLSERPCLREALGTWQMCARRRVSLLDGNTFLFLNEIGRLSELGWEGLQRDRLWRYNQHYFDDLNAVDAHLRFRDHHELLLRWVQENPLGVGTGWEPYPTSLRIVNWVKWQTGGGVLPEMCLQSLAMQTRWLVKKIEWHILGNHLFANAKALVFAGIFFDGPEARGWLNVGLGIIAREIPEQVLLDGGNFELSPMYHSIFLEDVLDLINLSQNYPDVVEKKHSDLWRMTACKMLEWLDGLCHPDGEISFFNDAAIGVAPSPDEIKAYATRLEIFTRIPKAFSDGVKVIRFSESGYVRLEAVNAVALLDVAPIGPDYLPGHAHADTLSFELSLFGERVFVNSGISRYGTDQVRMQERGTAAHNTVEVNGSNSSEVWSGFRVARRAYPHDLMIDESSKSVTLSCAHDGYTRLPGRPVHRRIWELSCGKLVLIDQISKGAKSAIARFHLHPDIEVSAITDCEYQLYLPVSEQRVRLLIMNGSPRIECSVYSPEFGISQETKCVAVQFETASSDIGVEILWSIDE